MSRFTPVLAVALLALFASSLHAAVQVDSNLPKYEPVDGVSGTIKSVGSDTMNNMMTLWGEGFKAIYPNVTIEVEGKGSSTAPPALIAGTAAFGPMSRQMKDKEIDAFKEAFGYEPVQLATAIDMLAVFVHKDNPIDGLSLPEVDAIFSGTRKGGHGDVTTWGQVGLEGDWANAQIGLYGRNAASGTYGYFKKKALFQGDFKETVKEQPGSSSVVQGVAGDQYAIGYSGIGYQTADVKAVALSKEGEGFVAPTPDNAGSYPLSRYLWLSVNKDPNEELDPLRAEFIKYIYSQQGQKAVVKDGYLPVSAVLAEKQLAQVGL